MDAEREFLRHTLATLAYRAARALDGAPEEFAWYTGAGRTPGEILAHMGDLFDWALASPRAGRPGTTRCRSLGRGEARFFAALKAFDAVLAWRAAGVSEVNGCSRVRLPTRSPTPANSPCSGAWRDTELRAKTTSWPGSRWDRPEKSSPTRCKRSKGARQRRNVAAVCPIE